MHESAKADKTSRGSTLIEVLILTTIMGIVIVGVLSAVGTAVTASRVHRSAATADTVVRDYAESLRIAVTKTGAWCTAAGYDVAYSPPSGYAVSQSVGACPADNVTTPQFQSVTLTATALDGGPVETINVVVRQP